MIKRFFPLAAMALAVSSAFAAPVEQTSDEAFYSTPTTIPANHGELLSYRTATLNLGDSALTSATVNAWNVKYATQADPEQDVEQVATGTVYVPKAGVKGVILYAVGTHGLGQRCAASKQLTAGTDYERANIAAALKAGYAVLVTDYVGYTAGKKPRYMAGESQGRNVLDIFKAATQLPNSGISSTAKVAIWGFSQGGQAAGWAAQLYKTYTPGLNVVGVAAGGIPGDFFPTAPYLNQRNGSSFLFQTVLGLYEEYGDAAIPFSLVLAKTPEVTADMAKIQSQCVFESLFDFQNQDIARFTIGGQTKLETLMQLTKVTLDKQSLGKIKVDAPVYQYHGEADQFIPLGQAFDLKKRWCDNGTKVKFDLYPGEHIITQFQAATPALNFINERMAGSTTFADTCSNRTAPVSTANANTGDLLVSLKKWPLAAVVKVKGLMNQDVILPAASTFSAETNINKKTLLGNLSVPDFRQSLKVIGIGAQIGMKISPVGDTTGNVELTREGVLKVTGVAKTDITITSVWGIPFGQCKTERPVEFPLNYDGPLSGLGHGLKFAGETSFPPIKGCIISGIITALMSGPGQKYEFTVTPPAPRAN